MGGGWGAAAGGEGSSFSLLGEGPPWPSCSDFTGCEEPWLPLFSFEAVTVGLSDSGSFLTCRGLIISVCSILIGWLGLSVF